MTLHRLRPAAARAAVCFALLACWLGADPAAARTLHWSLLDVDARIDAEGALHIVETQHMVFDGDWNGGERLFRLGPGHEIEAFSIARIDPESGLRHEMVAGSLDGVDHYDWADGRTVRWRSRLPSDPVFQNQTLVYELSYRLTGVLRARGEGVYRLWHDFAFTDRAGPIERFVLALEIDPAFEPIDPLPAELVREDLPPGVGVEVQGDLRYLPEGRPAAVVPPGASLSVQLFLFALAAAAAIWMLVHFFHGETVVGRSAWTAPRPAEVDREWIEREIVRLRPEVVGALWDRKVRAAEVSALIARLVGEGKLESSVETDPKSGKEELRLRRVAPVGGFRGGYEADLVSKLFVGGSDEVTTSELRKHYKKKGFDPAGVISGKLGKQVDREVPDAGTKRPAPPKLPAFVLLLAAAGCFAVEAVTRPAAAPGLLLPLLGVIPVLYLFGAALAAATRGQIERLGLLTVVYLVPLVAMAFGSALFLLVPRVGGPVPAGPFGVLAVVLANLAAWRSVTHMAMTRESRGAIAARQKLLHARRFFQAELQREQPDLADDWFPYLLAFGLSSALDRWSKAFGSDSGHAAALAGAGASTWSGTGGSSGGWSGGGGQFGGAGASGAWAVAASGLATGVAAPSSSGSGGGGGGGGGGSSGGGGGGGW